MIQNQEGHISELFLDVTRDMTNRNLSLLQAVLKKSQYFCFRSKIMGKFCQR